MIFQRLQRKVKKTLKSIGQPILLHILLSWLFHRQSLPITLDSNSAIVFAPHQDDETLGCGGLIALKRSQGASVWVAFLTDGAASSHASHQNDLAQTRHYEAIAALSILGVVPEMIIFLNYPDGQLQHLPHPECQLLVKQLAHIIDTLQPREVYIPHADDAHPDHKMTYKLVQSALEYTKHQPEQWQYPIWMFWNRSLEFDLKWNTIAQTYRLDIHGSIEQKIKALKTYSSQYPFFPKHFIQNFCRPYELFFK